MKEQSLFLTFLIISLSISLSAQTNKGNIIVGGLTYVGYPGSGATSMNIGYTTTKSKDDSGDEDDYKEKMFSLNFTPKVGYFIIDNLVLGVDMTLFSSFNKTTNTEYKSKSTLISAGPFVRYYIPTKKAIPFAEAMYSFGTQLSSSEWEGEKNTYDYGIQFYSVGIGVGIPLGEKASFDALVGYHSSTSKANQDNENNRRSVSGTIGLKLGFTIFLGSK